MFPFTSIIHNYKFCNFHLITSNEWYKISLTQIKNELVKKYNVTDKNAWAWANTLKYLTSSYLKSQEQERKENSEYLKSFLINNLDCQKIKNAITIGVNSGLEMFDICSVLKNIFEITCVDLSEDILKITAESLKNLNNVNINYCKAFIEDLGENGFDKGFDIAIALKLLQSSYFDDEMLKKTFDSVYKILKDDGIFLVSFPKNTFCGGIENKGVYKKGQFEDLRNSFKNFVEKLKNSNLFTDLKIFNENKQSNEFYLLCKKKKEF